MKIRWVALPVAVVFGTAVWFLASVLSGASTPVSASPQSGAPVGGLDMDRDGVVDIESGATARGVPTYRVCEAGTQVCPNEPR